MQSYPVIGILQVVDLEVVIRESYEEYLRIYVCSCGYICVHVGMNNFSEPNLG